MLSQVARFLSFLWLSDSLLYVCVCAYICVCVCMGEPGLLHCRWILYRLRHQGSICWAPKNWCLWTVMLEKTLKSPLDYKEIQPDHPKGSQSWIFIGRTDAEAETPILWPLDVKNWLIWKDPDAGKDWRQEEKGTTEDVVWASSGSWWWTGRPGVLQSMRLERVGNDWATELKCNVGDSSGGPVAKTRCSQCRRPRFNPWSGN